MKEIGHCKDCNSWNMELPICGKCECNVSQAIDILGTNKTDPNFGCIHWEKKGE